MTRGWDLTPARNLGARPEMFAPVRSDQWDYGPPGVHLHAPKAKRRRPMSQAGGELEPPPLAPGTPSVPVARLWPWYISEVMPNAGQVVSFAFNGPALVDFLMLSFDIDNVTPIPSITLRYAEWQGENISNVNFDTFPRGEEIFDLPSSQVEVGGIAIQQPRGFVRRADGTTNQAHNLPIRKIIELPRFFLHIAMGTQGAGAVACHGYVRVLEGESIQALAPYL